jgi:hypothetical protein
MINTVEITIKMACYEARAGLSKCELWYINYIRRPFTAGM